MTNKISGSLRKGDDALRGMLKLVDLEQQAKRPDMAVYVLDRRRQPCYVADVDDEGRFELPEKHLEDAHFVALGPATDDFKSLDKDKVMLYRTENFKTMLEEFSVVDIPKANWGIWFWVTSCVTGSVSHCFPYPWLVAELYQQVAAPLPVRRIPAGRAAAFERVANLELQPIQPLPIFPFFRCEPVCDGVVEVYRRVCCCHPWIILDPRLPRLIERLEELVVEIPPIKWPPGPRPDPPPFRELPFFKGGALDDLALNAPRDLAALRALPQPEQIAYIQARPYLLCLWESCGDPVKVAQGTIQPGGDFSICWSEFPWLLFPNCHFEYAYVVKQHINGATVTIYDGVAANKWFAYGDDAALVSYHPQAVGCRPNPFEDEAGAFALLQDIGLAESHRLKTPDATGWDRVASPGYNDGLADPVATAAAALGKYKNRNWGGTLRLRYHFSEDMKAVGAKYYRISVIPSDSNGNPTGTRTDLSAGLSWKKYVVVGTDINVETESLGPVSAGTENNLFLIPYDVDADWQNGQYHGYLNTTDEANGRHLVTMEVFNAAGQRIRPNGAGGAGIDTGFTFRRWYQPVGPTANVPFAALTHMFWWDNRKTIANIVDLRKNGVASTEQCQFMEGPAGTTFSVGYQAYHPNPIFLLNHSLWWRRGLGGPTGYLVYASPNNVGPAVGVSPTDTFANMLGPKAKCSFSLNLHTNVKTFNGIGTLNSLDDWDYASFALENTDA